MNKEEFINELKKINIQINDDTFTNLEKYYKLLITENEKVNLTSITEKDKVFLKHFYDSLTLNKIINLDNQTICDIGTGAGFPGLVLKIVFPNLKITLIDSQMKRCSFLNKVIETLFLKEVKVINERAEIFSRNHREKYDIVTSRAVASLSELLEYSTPLLKINGLFIAMKGSLTNENINIKILEKELNIKKDKEISFKLPIENSSRLLISFLKISKTNLKYPRNYNIMKKKSL